MIYDEGFEIEFEDVNYLGFSKYFRSDDYTYKSDCS